MASFTEVVKQLTTTSVRNFCLSVNL